MGPSVGTGNGSVWRKDKTLYVDLVDQIAGQLWESQFIFDIEQLAGVMQFHGLHFTAKGTATQFTITGWGPEHGKGTLPRQNDLTLQPAGERILRQWSFKAENMSVEFRSDSGWFELIEFQPYFTPWVRQR
jgi:hypothetical protein